MRDGKYIEKLRRGFFLGLLDLLGDSYTTQQNLNTIGYTSELLVYPKGLTNKMRRMVVIVFRRNGVIDYSAISAYIYARVESTCKCFELSDPLCLDKLVEHIRAIQHDSTPS
jgi:uncharacterized protein (DUF697 family)